MKVAMIITSLEVGGAEKMVIDLVSYLNKKITVKLFVIRENYQTIYDHMAKNLQLDVLYLNSKIRIFDLKTAKKMSAILDEFHPDIIHTHLKSSSYIYYYYQKRQYFRWVHTTHTIASIDVKPIRRMLFKRLYNQQIIKVVAVSDSVLNSLISLYKNIDVELVYNGVNINNFFYKKKEIENLINICHIGRFVPVKNHRYIISEFYNLSLTNKNIYLYLIGDGPLREKVKEQVKSLKLQNRVIFVGYTSNVQEYLDKSHIFWLPSVYEGMPIALIEAMASGLVCVASALSSQNVIDNRKNGFLIDLHSQELSQITQNIIDNYNKIASLRINASLKACTYTVSRMAERYLEIYEKP